MAHHASAKKRIRQTLKRNIQQRYYRKSTRTAMKKLRAMSDASEAQAFLPKVISMVDKLAKRNIWHKNKANNIKSKLMHFVNTI
ncbi:MAG: 30S ribosomal protein S20 [Saprospiraceae bacterium]|nr:30S ribosomal protein S20 [Saprospiraceae bacterium]